MSKTALIETLTGSKNTMTFYGLPVQGGFDITAQSSLVVSANSSTYPINISSVIKYTCLGTHKELVTTTGHSDLRGMNVSYIAGDSGSINIPLLRDAVAKNSAVPSAVRGSWINEVMRVACADSHVTFIYNMLVSWYKAVLYQSSTPAHRTGRSQPTGGDIRHATITLRLLNYQDTHVRVTCQADEAAVVGVDVTLAPPSRYDGGVIDQYHMGVSAQPRSNVIFLPAISDEATGWFISHVEGRDMPSDLNFEFTIPGVDLSDVLVHMSDATAPRGTDPNLFDWTNSDKMWLYISSYVKLNRVESHFAAAYELFGSLAYRPLAESAEGFIYSRHATRVYLPDMKFYRGRYTLLLEGDPWEVPHEALDLVLKVQSEVHSHIAACAFANYVSHIGSAAAAGEGMLVYDDLPNGLDASRFTNIWTTQASAQHSGGLSAVLGRDFPTHFTAQVGVIYPLSEPFKTRYPHAVPATTGADTTGFDLTGAGLYPRHFTLPASLAQIYGHASAALTMLTHCQASSSVVSNTRDKILTYEEALVTAVVWRLAGYNPRFRDVQTGLQVAPYGSLNAMGIVPGSLTFIPKIDTTYGLLPFNARNGSPVIPQPHSAMDSGGFKVTMRTDAYAMTVPGNRHSLINTNYRRPRELKRVEIRVPAGGNTPDAKTTVPARDNTIKEVQDFHMEQKANPDTPAQ